MDFRFVFIRDRFNSRWPDKEKVNFSVCFHIKPFGIHSECELVRCGLTFRFYFISELLTFILFYWTGVYGMTFYWL